MERYVGYNFQHIHSAAATAVQPKTEYYHTSLLRKLQLSYGVSHDLNKNSFQRDKPSVHSDEAISPQDF